VTAPIPSRRSAARTFAPAVAWTCLVLAATSLPGTAVPASGRVGLDKLAHFGLYLVLAALWSAAARRSRPAGRGAHGGRGALGVGWLLIPGLAIFAGLDELHQAWIPGRYPSPADWAADLAGIGVGTWLEARRAGRGRSGRVEHPHRRSRDGG
jgi:VanZ family protein